MAKLFAFKIYALACFLTSSAAASAVSAHVHALCKEAKDYQGCVKAQIGSSNSLKSKTTDAQAGEQNKCIAQGEIALAADPVLLRYANNKDRLGIACSSALEAYHSFLNDQSLGFMAIPQKEKSAKDVWACVMQGVLGAADGVPNPVQASKGVCYCNIAFNAKNPSVSEKASQDFCLSLYRAGEVAGFRLLSDKAGLRYGYRESSIRQVLVNGSYGRYLSFLGRSESGYSGSSGYVIPGTPGYINCGYSGGGSLNGWSSGGSCYGQGGTSPLYVPGQSGGVQAGIFPYLLDCRDKTFDRKGDVSDVYGGRKGWMDISEDPVASAVAQAYCPIIEVLPKLEHVP